MEDSTHVEPVGEDEQYMLAGRIADILLEPRPEPSFAAQVEAEWNRLDKLETWREYVKKGQP